MSFAKQRIEELKRELAQAEEELTPHTVEVNRRQGATRS